MTSRASLRQAAAGVLAHDEVAGVLKQTFYSPEPRTEPARTVPEERPTHYKIICISLYTEDLNNLDGMVDRLKARGLTKANRSALIRYALSQVDLDRVPRGL